MSSSTIVGMDANLRHIWKLLMNEEYSGIFAIVGVGGVGKTTLLRQIINKLATTPHPFHPVIWVTVSRNLSVEKLQDDIWKSIRTFDSNWVLKSFHEKSEALAQFFCGKKFVLVLDDVLGPFQLSDLGIPGAEEGTDANYFKVILTSRSEPACRTLGARLCYRVSALDGQTSRALFEEKLGKDKLADPKILRMVDVIVPRCLGLPLCLCTVARAMACRTTDEEWEDALTQVREAFRIGGVDNVLAFCFDCLPSDITRSCIIYFSLLPEDFSIPKNELIDFWICEHLLGHEQDVLNLGYNTIQSLIGASLLLEEQVNSVKLQDLVRDFALVKAFESQMFENALLIGATDNEALETLGWVVQMRKSVEDVASVPQKLWTFLLTHNPFVVIKGEFSQFMDALTVLDLSNSGVEVVPRELSNLVSLQYLNLSHNYIDCLPIELKMLTKLKCLNLEHDRLLRVVPKKLIFSLHLLQVLKLFRCGFSVEELGDNILSVNSMDINPLLSLKHLQVLSITITCTSALHKFFSSPKLISCTQSVSLEVFWGTESIDISPLADMKNLLILEIHQAEKLQKLSFDMHFSELLKERRFERLEEVTVEDCSSLQELTWVVVAQNLVSLRVKGCEQMKEIISIAELDDTPLEPFSKLGILDLEDLPELKSIYWKPLSFRYLKKIRIVNCSLLRELPLNADSAKANELVIEADEGWWGNVEWVDDATKERLK